MLSVIVGGGVKCCNKTIRTMLVTFPGGYSVRSASKWLSSAQGSDRFYNNNEERRLKVLIGCSSQMFRAVFC